MLPGSRLLTVGAALNLFTRVLVRVAGAAEPPGDPSLILPTHPDVAVMGRIDRTEAGQIRMGYPGVTLRLRFEGSGLTMRASSTSPNSHIAVLLDGAEPRVVRLAKGDGDVVLAQGQGAGSHTVDVVHRTETWQGVVTVRGFRLAAGGRLLSPDPWPSRRMLFIGDSVTCGEQVDRRPDCQKDPPASWNPSRSYAMLLGRALDAQVHLVCYGGRGVIRDWRGRSDVLNAPQFFDLAVPEDSGAPAWDHSTYRPDVVFVSLGTNDFNLGTGELPAREEFVSAYVRLAKAIRSHYPAAQVFLTEGAIVSDDVDPKRPQKTVLRGYLVEVARRLSDPRVRVVDSRHYPGDACNAHPTGEQHAAMARDFEPVIRAALGW